VARSIAAAAIDLKALPDDATGQAAGAQGTADSIARPGLATAGPSRRSPATEPDSVVAINETLNSLWAFSIPTRTLGRGFRGNWLVGAVISGVWPLLVNGVLVLAYGRIALHSRAAWLWLTIFAVTEISGLLAARILWGRLIRDMPLISSMLPNEDAHKQFAAWVRSWSSGLWQAVSGFTLAALGAFVLWLASPAVGQHLELGLASYIAVAWTSFMGGLVIYVFVMVTLMTFKMRDCGPLDLDEWDPARTPGLVTLSRGYVYCLGAIIVMAAGLEIVATRVPGYQDSMVLGAFVVGFPIFAVLCGIFISLLPHIAFARMTYDCKVTTIEAIDEAIGGLRELTSGDHGRIATLVWLRNQVSGAANLPIKAPWFVPLAAALVGPLVAFLLTLKG
jgi:hypothetical protein